MQFLNFPAFLYDFLHRFHVIRVHMLRLPGDTALFYPKNRLLQSLLLLLRRQDRNAALKHGGHLLLLLFLCKMLKQRRRIQFSRRPLLCKKLRHSPAERVCKFLRLHIFSDISEYPVSRTHPGDQKTLGAKASILCFFPPASGRLCRRRRSCKPAQLHSGLIYHMKKLFIRQMIFFCCRLYVSVRETGYSEISENM